MASINQKLGLYQDVYLADKYTTINYLSAARLANVDTLSTAVVQLYGSWSDRFPLYLATKGRSGGVTKIKSLDGLYTINIIGKPKKSSAIAKTIYTTADKIGVGKGEFLIWMTDNWLKKSDVVSTFKDNQILLTSSAQAEGQYYKYTCKLMGSDSNNYISVAEISAGARLASMFSPAGLINSRGRESRSQAPAKMQNQTGFLRRSYNWKGNVASKVMNISLPKVGGGTTTYWQEWEMFQNELHYLEEIENYMWYAKWNRNEQGIVMDKDVDTAEVMPTSSGLLEQIPNSSTYGILTVDKISRVVRDVMYNSSADKTKEITLYTGIGGQEEFSKAMFREMSAMSFQFQTSTKVIDGAANSHDLTYGAYFGTYKHVDGHTVKIKRLPMLDMGAKAEAAPKHPVTGLPITSYDMYFIDESVVEGRPNIQYVCEEGREDIKKWIRGMNDKTSDTISTDQDASSIQMAKSVGIQMLNPVNSFKMFCNLS